MKPALLASLLERRAAAEPVVLVTQLDNGDQWMLGSAGESLTCSADVPMPERVRAAAVEALAEAANRHVALGSARFFLHSFPTPYRLIVVGGVHIAQALIPMAQSAGFEVELVDPRTAFATEARFEGVPITHEWPEQALANAALSTHTAVVTLSHDPKFDEPALAAALRADCFYIGALGSRKTHERRIERLMALGFSDATLARIHAPIGLPLGGRAPAEIAIAIIAQIVQARYRTED